MSINSFGNELCTLDVQIVVTVVFKCFVCWYNVRNIRDSVLTSSQVGYKRPVNAVSVGSHGSESKQLGCTYGEMFNLFQSFCGDRFSDLTCHKIHLYGKVDMYISFGGTLKVGMGRIMRVKRA